MRDVGDHTHKAGASPKDMINRWLTHTAASTLLNSGLIRRSNRATCKVCRELAGLMTSQHVAAQRSKLPLLTSGRASAAPSFDTEYLALARWTLIHNHAPKPAAIKSSIRSWPETKSKSAHGEKRRRLLWMQAPRLRRFRRS